MAQDSETTRSIDTILDWFKTTVEAKAPIPPTKWIEASEYLNVLLGSENDKLVELEQKVALAKLGFMEAEENKSVAEAKTRIEATDIYKEAKRQKNKIAQIIEFIRLGKLHGRLYAEELRGH